MFESPHEFVEYDLMSVQKQEMIEQYLDCPAYRIVPTEGLMVLFPSHLRHGVEQNQSDEDRISMAFNIDFRKIDDDVTVIDNFLDNKSFLDINDKIMNDAFPWFWFRSNSS